MVAKNRRAEKQRTRRRKKLAENRSFTLRRQQALGTDRYPVYACRINKDWRDDGIAAILFAREIAPRRLTMAGFLVDIWAMGLKDAWGRVDMPASEFEGAMSDHDQRLKSKTVDLDTVRHLVFGGIEQARELGFRLPRKYERWTALLGPLPEGMAPDMSLFRKDGKILLRCNEPDLRARLVGCTVDEFLSRPDVDYILGDDDFTLVDEEADEFDDGMMEMEEAMLDAVKAWCFANGQAPHPLLPDVVRATMEVSAAKADEENYWDQEAPDISASEVTDFAERIESYLLVRHGDRPDEARAAIAQMIEFMHSKTSPDDLFESLDLSRPLDS